MKIRAGALSLFIAAGALAPAVAPASSACAAEGEFRAGLVVDTGRGNEPLSMCVDLGDDKQVTGIELIKLASKQYGLQYQLGYGGDAVCQLANVPDGDPPEDCFDGADEFWGYWRGDGSGGWETSQQGAGSTIVESGDVDGWSYGPGKSAETHAKPRNRKDGSRYTFESICPSIDELEEKDPETPPEDKENDGRETGGIDIPNLPNTGSEPKDEKTPDPLPTPEPEPDDRLIDSAPDVSELEVAPSPSPTSSELPAGATSARSEAENQLPFAGALAVLATIAMALIAVFLIRKRSSTGPEG